MNITSTVVIPTERSGVSLRFYNQQIVEPLFALIDRNRPHLSQYNDDTARKYPDLASVEATVTEPTATKIRFGIWDGDTLVGVINLRPIDDAAAEIGYFLGAEFQGKYYTRLALQALLAFARDQLNYRLILATVHPNNDRSILALERVGFRKIREDTEAWRFGLLFSEPTS